MLYSDRLTGSAWLRDMRWLSLNPAKERQGFCPYPSCRHARFTAVQRDPTFRLTLLAISWCRLGGLSLSRDGYPWHLGAVLSPMNPPIGLLYARGDCTPQPVGIRLGVANPTPGKTNLRVKCQIPRESQFARALITANTGARNARPFSRFTDPRT